MTTGKATREDFELESGLPDDFDAVITRSWFGFKEEYQKGQVPLLLLDLEGEEIEPTNVAFSIGADWKITDGGHRVEHPKGKKRFVATSMIGRLIDRTVNKIGIELWERGFPTEADIWTGLAFHWMREEISFGPGILEEKGGKTTHLMPTDYLPDFKVGETAAPAVEPELETKLAALAKASDDFNAFAKAALKVSGVGDSPKLINSVLDESDKGFYAQHKG
ncbi:hypothetical protein ES708_03677 [subsurface metagenome]